jgi:hypothetical protein
MKDFQVETFVDTPHGEVRVGEIVIGKELNKQCGYDVIVRRKDNGNYLYTFNKSGVMHVNTK